jgi:DNA mismatch repair protein MutS2
VADADRKKLAGPALRRVAKSKRELREEMETTILSTQDDARQGELGQRRAKIEEGVRVRVKGIREPARVRRRLSDDLVEVEAGFMKLQVPEDEILEVLPAADSPVARHVSFDAAPLSTGSIREINVIGEHADEACAKVEKFLDNAVLADASRVRIVHGYGMGILRRAIADLLASNPNVEKFYPAEQHEGGAGATIVELKG